MINKQTEQNDNSLNYTQEIVGRTDTNVFTPKVDDATNDKAIIEELKKLMRSVNVREQNH